jgi:hypothetical protein
VIDLHLEYLDKDPIILLTSPLSKKPFATALNELLHEGFETWSRAD